MNVTEQINNLINNIADDENALKYLYNSNKKFIPGETPIYYSGPYWDNKEVEKAVGTFLMGKWLSSGENIYKFEKKFSYVHISQARNLHIFIFPR